ncbi:MAG: PKD domain-containing protein [Candidatus Cloacimonetes bacterium]|nr:PKD domain-containing protein [Candidatus Cloacimonadota bacterium]
MKKNMILLILLHIFSTLCATTIYDIQYTNNAGDGTYPSPMDDQDVTITGIVTATNYGNGGAYQSFYVCDLPEIGVGAWHGIMVFNTDAQQSPELGDEVEVSATVTEYYGLTELGYATVTVLSTGNPVPAPVSISCAVLSTTEDYESVLVRLDDLTVVQEQDDYGQWLVTDGTGICQIDDSFFYLDTVDPPIIISVGDTWEQIIGIVDFGYDEFGLNPRFPEDMVDVIEYFGYLECFVDNEYDEPLENVLVNVNGENYFTDIEGFTEIQLPIGIYSVIFSLDGYGIYTLDAVEIFANETTELDIMMIEIIANFEAQPTFGLTPLEVLFTDISEGNISQWQWDFENDGTIDSYEQHPTHVYMEAGIYSVSLRAGDGNNFITEVKNNLITVGEQLLVDFEATPTVGFSPLEVQFTDLSEGGFLNLSNQFKNNLRDIDSWEWDFDNDGTIDSYEQNPTFIYTDYGNFSVSLTASDGVQTITETKIDFIEVEPILADFEANPVIGLYPLIVQFTDLSQSATNRMNSKGKNRDILSWEWDFDNDGTIDSDEQNPAYTYENCGSFTVTLTVSDGTFYDTETKNNFIIVGEPIIANFEATPLIGYIPLEVQFTDLSEGGIEYRNNNKTSIRDITNWKWDYENDGTIDSNEQNPTHIYYEEGIFSVSLKVSDGIHEIEIVQENLITVGYPLYANFEASPLSGTNPLEVIFTDLSLGGIPTENNREIVTWFWDFQNDGTIDSYEQNPTFTYSELGLYSVALIVGDGFGTDSITQLDYIEVTSSNANNGILNIHTKLISNYPNPFNPVTTIEFNIKENETGILNIYNVKGQILETKQFESGNHEFIWNAEKQASGVYFYQIKTENFSQVKKMIMMK